MGNRLIGIQGGLGSYNDTAIRKHLPNDFTQDKVVYLDSTPNVFVALNSGQIEYGQFAIYNSRSGLYEESLEHIAHNTFRIVDKYAISVNHSLMIHSNQTLNGVEQIITHKEVVKQCRNTINKYYGNIPLHLTSGKTIDPSNIAAKIASEDDFANIAVIGNPTLAEVYGLKVEKNNLSDSGNSQSTFLLIRR